MSRRVEMQSLEFRPPFPSSFGNVESPLFKFEKQFEKKEPWGLDGYRDALQIMFEGKYAVQMFPDSHLHMVTLALFSSLLLGSAKYSEVSEKRHLLNIQASLLRDYFKTTGEPSAGVESLMLHEASVALCADELSRALELHNCAMAIYSLLAMYGEQAIAKSLGRPNLRREAIGYAAVACKAYQAEAAREAAIEEGPASSSRHSDDELPKGTATSSQQVARTHHLIGDLLRIGGSQDDLRSAIGAFNLAIEAGLPEKLERGVRHSRAETIALLDSSPPELLLEAEADLLSFVKSDHRTLARRDVWPTMFKLAVVYQKQGKGELALAMLEEAASAILYQLRLNWHELLLEQKSRRLIGVFQELARAYLNAGRIADALDAVETLRAATIRLHTISDREQNKKAKKGMRALGDHLLPDVARKVFDHFLNDRTAVDPVERLRPAITRLRKALADVPTACVSLTTVRDGQREDIAEIVAFICADALSKDEIRMLRWPLAENARQALQLGAVDLVPGPFREDRLQRLHRTAYNVLLAPLDKVLAKAKVERVVFSLPALFTRFAVEAMSDPSLPNSFMLDRYRLCYVPSLAVGNDLAQRTRGRRVKKLLVVGYQGDDLTHAAKEVEALHKLFGSDMTLLSGAACNKERVIEELNGSHDGIHFICHGTYDEAMPLNAALHFVPNVEDDSQALSATDVMEHVHFQNKPILTLSACSSALMAADEINTCHGLVGSFLRAGAHGVVGSRWPVYDDIAASFMSNFYARIRSSEDAQASFCDTQRELRRDGRVENFAAFGYIGMP